MKRRYSEVIASSALIAALYGFGTWVISPIAYGPIQVRLTDTLLMLCYLNEIGYAAILGNTIGVLIANYLSPYGAWDMALGLLANLSVGVLIYMCGKREIPPLFAGVIASMVIALIIGVGLLGMVFNLPMEVGFIGVFLGEAISLILLGVPLLESLRKRIQERR